LAAPASKETRMEQRSQELQLAAELDDRVLRLRSAERHAAVLPIVRSRQPAAAMKSLERAA
jgi:hypothetical protein